ncbi:ABC transporter permease [Nocardia sp. NPDC058499]|uniref:ABC transporter permease n=1 Tax=Nocardia sp. NPDC058499 TaxID=3346530 RepID=UPI00365BB614
MNTAALICRGITAEWTRTAGRGFLWTAAVPLALVLPLLVTFGIAAVAERFATVPGQLEVMSVPTTNSVYWVITLAVSVLTVTAAYAHAAAQQGRTSDLAAFLFPRSWTAALARWIFYGAVAALVTLILVALIMTVLPLRFPHVYGAVDIGSPAGIRFLWAVPLYAFIACGIGIAVGSLVRAPAAAVAVVLFWVHLAENSISLLPNGYALQAYAPFLNGVAATGQEMAFLPRFGPAGSLIYFLAVALVLFLLSAVLRAAAHRSRGRTR